MLKSHLVVTAAVLPLISEECQALPVPLSSSHKLLRRQRRAVQKCQLQQHRRPVIHLVGLHY